MMLEIPFRAIAACAALAVAAPVALAADAAVLPVRGTNLTPGELDAIGVLLAGAYAREARAEVVGPAETGLAVAEAGGVAAAVARLGVREVLEAAAVQLKSRIILEVTLRDAAGAVLHAAKMTAASLDDVEPVAVRITRALVLRTNPDETRTPGSVTRREGQAPNRLFTEKVMGLKTSLTWPFASGRDFDPSITFQFDGRLELARGFLEFGAGAAIPTSGEDEGMGGVFAEIGGSLYLLESDTSPYVGTGIVPRIYFSSDAGGIGAALYVQAGLMFMRASSSRVYAELRVTQTVTPFEVLDYDGSTTGSTVDRYYPTEVGLQVGIGW